MYLESTFKLLGSTSYPDGTTVINLQKSTGRRQFRLLNPDEYTLEEGDRIRLTIENHTNDSFWTLDEFHGRNN